MQAWIRFERWVLGTLGVFWLAYVSFALHSGGVKEPVPDLGNPASIRTTGNSTRIAYHLSNVGPEELSKLDVQLQIKGYKRPPETWMGLYMKSRREFVHVYHGRLRILPSGQSYVSPEPNTATVVHTVRPSNWTSIWRRVRRDWTRRQQAQRLRATQASNR